jgi:hypothetical protein
VATNPLGMKRYEVVLTGRIETLVIGGVEVNVAKVVAEPGMARK